MRINTRFRLTSLFVVVAVSATILGGVRWSRQAEAIHELNQQAERAIAGAYRLELFGLEYLYKRSERARQQWLLTYARLEQLVGAGLARDPATERIRTGMAQDLTRLRGIFSQLAARGAQAGQAGKAPSGPDGFSQRLSGQLAISTAAFVDDVQRLQDHYANARDRFRRGTMVGGVGAIGALIVLIVWLQGSVTRRLVGKITRLTSAVQGFPGQAFSIPVADSGPDELDELGETFQTMANSVMAFQRSLAAEIDKEKAIEQQLSLVIEGAALGYWDWDYPSGRLTVNDRWRGMLGLDHSDFHGDLSDWSDRLHPKDRERVLPLIERHIQRGEPYAVEFRMRHKHGHWVWIQGSGATVEFDPDTGRPIRACGTHQDISERKDAQDKLIRERAFLQTVVDGVGDPILVVGKDYRVMLANRAARVENRAAPAADGQLRCHQLLHGSDQVCDGQDQPCPLRRVLETRQPVRVVHNHVSDDQVRTFELLATPLHDERGEIMGIIEASRDITDHLLVEEELKAKDRVLHHLAHHDSLTGLPNRLLFTDRLNQALHKAHRSLLGAALLFIDLDHFKEINDSLGHSIGDRLLHAVSERLCNAVREDDTVARLGGDEFTVIMGQLRDPDDALVLTQKLIGSFRTPFRVDNHELHISASIGLSLYPEDGEEAETLLRNADAAMYRAKAEGRNTFQFYTADMTAKAFERMLIEGELRKALADQQLVLHYQAQLQIGTGRVIGAEALIRWLHPERGMIPPARFVPVAEQSGQIVEIGRWVLETVCSRSVAWRESAHPPVRVAVNLSAKQLTQGSIADLVRDCLENSGCDARYLELEITEGYLMRNPERAVADLEALRGMGVGLAVDDFGTGYSSLSYLKQLPITKLKIDRSFVRDITHDPNDQAISRAIIALGKSLGLNVIAEGVETEAQRDFLQAEGCEQAQGSYYTRPLPEDDFLRFLESHA